MTHVTWRMTPARLGLAFLVALAALPVAQLALGWSPASAALEEGAVRSLHFARVAYIQGDDEDMAEGYLELFSDYGATVHIVDQGDVAETSFAAFDYIVIGPDTEWDEENADDAEHIHDAGKPILGLGAGGALFFDVAGLEEIGHAASALTDPHSGLGVVNESDAPWNGPNPVPLPDEGSDAETVPVVELYDEPGTFYALDVPEAPEGADSDGMVPDEPGYYAILSLDDMYRQWGGTLPPDALTESGRYALTNFLATLPRSVSLNSMVLPMLAADP